MRAARPASWAARAATDRELAPIRAPATTAVAPAKSRRTAALCSHAPDAAIAATPVRRMITAPTIAPVVDRAGCATPRAFSACSTAEPAPRKRLAL